MNNLPKLFFPAALLLLTASAQAQIPAFPLTREGLVINRPTQPVQPFTVAGTSGVLVGTQDGQFESWILPIKLLSHLTIEANLEGYSVPIPVNPQSAQIEVRPDHTTITYAHLGFTIRQIMFSLDSPTNFDRSREASAPRRGPIVLFQIEANHPLDLTFRFTPEMRWMWPKRNEGIPSPEWVHIPPTPSPSAAGVPPSAQDFYLLHLDYPDLVGAITIPTATPGILAPYQERPQVHPLELHLHYDPKRDGDKYFPLLMAAGTTHQSSSREALGNALSELNASIPTLYTQHAARYQKLFSESTSIQTPDHALNEAFQWGIASIEQLKAEVPTFQSDPNPTPTTLNPEVPQVSTPQTQPGVPQVSTPQTQPEVPQVSTPQTQPEVPQVSAPQTQPGVPQVSAPQTQPGVPQVSAPQTQPGVPQVSTPQTQPGVPQVSTPQTQPGVPQVSTPQTQPGVPQVSPLRPGNDAKLPSTFSSPETALVAGYYASGDSARPGFGWFFGRDSLYTLYAVNAYGDFALTRSELEFLIARQRADGKIMHEFAQTAADPSVHWRDFEYMYAAADATPLFLMAMRDYYRASGDKAFLASHKAAIDKAWAFETAPTSDTDHDGIYDNSQGTGWTESWHGDPHQEVYLALLDEQASQAYAAIQSTLGNTSAAQAANTRAEKIKTTIESEYYDPAKSCYAFSINPDHTQDKSTTVYPAIAWWDDNRSSSLDPRVGGTVEGHDFSRANKTQKKVGASAPASSPDQTNQPLAHPEACLAQFAAPTLATDWGLRDVADSESFYDGMSYHQGSVWPLFTGWGALAEYRANQPLPAQQMLMQNVDLTWAQDPGAVTELLSGDFYVPFGRSTSHQLWSSAMVITPTLRGLFGINLDAAANTITVNPHLPANWDHADVNNIHFGKQELSLSFEQRDGILKVTVLGETAVSIRLRTDQGGSRTSSTLANGKVLSIPLPDVQLILPPHNLPNPGSRPEQLKILNTEYGPRSITVRVAGIPGSETGLMITHRNVRLKLETSDQNGPSNNIAKLLNAGGDSLPLSSQDKAAPLLLNIQFPPIPSQPREWQTQQFTLTW